MTTLFPRLCYALCLLTGDPGQKPVPMLDVSVGDARAVALAWEVLGPLHWQMHLGDNYENAVQLLRERFWEVANYPPLADLKLFPCEKALRQSLAHTDAFLEYLKQRREFEAHNRDVIDETILETEKCRRVYDTLVWCYARGSEYRHRREWLNDLRTLLGAENYYRGLLPPPIPVWRLPDGG